MFAFHRLLKSSSGARIFLLLASLFLPAALLFSTALAKQTRNPAPTPVQPKMQPLDPLTRDEADLAAAIAGIDARVKEALGSGRQQLIRVEFLAYKSSRYRDAREPEHLAIGRHAAVIFYSYDQDLGVLAIVELDQGFVREVTKMPGRTVPLGAAEVTEAFNLAVRNERVRSLLGSRADEFRVAGLSTGERPENRVEGLRIVSASPNDPCYRHRCLDLIFRTREGYLVGTQVTVDLTAQTVRVERTAK